MRKLLVLAIFSVLFSFLPPRVMAMTAEEKIRTEADYILSCQCTDKDSPAYGAINNVAGSPTWVSEIPMAGLGLLVAYEKLGDIKYRQGAGRKIMRLETFILDNKYYLFV